MGWTAETIVGDWLKGKSIKGTALTCDKSAISSYALVLAFRDGGDVWFLETVKGISVTTYRHFRGVDFGLSQAGYHPSGESSIRASGYPNRNLDRVSTDRKYVRMARA